jgi:hypothetical protein
MGGVGPAWTRGEGEKPLGEKAMGGWTAAVYTAEQQARLGVDEFGSPKSQPTQEVTNIPVSNPSEPVHPMIGAGLEGRSHQQEAPQGTKNMGTWTAAVYTAEQQARLGVTEMGEAVKKSKPVQPTSDNMKLKGQENGCVRKEDGVWCPQNDGSWVNQNTGKTWRKQVKAYKEGCVNKDDGLWCPQADGTWMNLDNGRKWSRTSEAKHSEDWLSRLWSKNPVQRRRTLLGGMAVFAVLLCGLVVGLIYLRRRTNARRYQEQVDHAAPTTSTAPALPSHTADEPHPPAYVETESRPPAYSSTV